jgi:P27 family predicted phage terminase small subunit
MPRAPRVNLDNDIQKRSNEHLKTRDENTPVYLQQEFVPPPTLTSKEREVWDWLVSIFRETINCRVSDADVHLMELYCRAKVAADEAAEEIKKDPRAYIIVALGKDKNGNLKTTAKPNPYRKIFKENAALCIKLFDQLGLSPLARARAGLAAANAKVDEEMEILKSIMERSDD